jgi:hypothetical protein
MIFRLPASRSCPVLFLACLLALCVPAFAQDKPEPASESRLAPSGQIAFEYGQAAFILSGSGGKGTLSFNKKKYRIKLGGLGIGGFGAARITATGEVFNLKSLADFEGAYVQGRMGYAFGEGKGSLWLENAHGVVLKLKTKNKGVVLSLGGDGLVIEFAKKK